MPSPALPALRFSGAALLALARAVRTAPGVAAARAIFRHDLGIDRLASLPESWRGPTPLDTAVVPGRAPRQPHDAGLGALPATAAWPRPAASLVASYARGERSPREVLARALAARTALAAQGQDPLLALDPRAQADADASADRYQRTASLGPLDGVPFVVKEETAIGGLPLRLGGNLVAPDPAPRDATIVARLRAQGAIVLGQSSMTEYGMSPLGINPQRTMPRNPYSRRHVAGGSSTGSAVAVALGLCPLAIAADGGGSIRIPASLSGLFGLKPTWGRVSRAGDAFGGSMNHLGPIGASTADLAEFFEACAQPDDDDPQTRPAPALAPGAHRAAIGRGVRGLRIGVLTDEIDAAAPPIAAACRAALAALEKEGATLQPLTFDFARHTLPIGCVIIASETYAMLRADLRSRPDALGPDLQITMQTAGALSLDDFLDAWRLRAGLRQAVAALLRDVDVLALPTTAATAPAITDDEARSGIADARAIGGACRFSFLANLTGLPAGTAPVGHDADGLPFGLQIVGDAYDEPTVLAVLAHLERTGAAVVRPPPGVLDSTS